MAKSATLSARYTSADGFKENRTFKTVAGLAAYVEKWAGVKNVIGSAAVSDDGIGRVQFQGATAEELVQALAPAAPSLAASKKASKAPSKAVVTKAQPAGPIAALAAALAAPAQAPKVAAPTVVPTRAHGTVQAVKMGTKAYRVKAGHNAETWQLVCAALAAGPAPVETVAKAAQKHTGGTGAVGFIGYCVRRGYLAVA